MKRLGVLIATCLVLALTACQSTSKTDSGTKPGNGTANDPSEPKLSEAKPPTFSTNSAPDTGEAVTFPFSDFPKEANVDRGQAFDSSIRVALMESGLRFCDS